MTYIVSSPYTEPNHLLDLSKLPVHYQLLAKSLTKFESFGDYANQAYEDSFNLDQVIGEFKKMAQDIDLVIPKFSVYIVGFRSMLHKEIQQSIKHREILYGVDKASHQEANLSGGLLKYWYGEPNSQGKNLATCWWVGSEYAKVGGGGKNHKQGVQLVRSWYKLWEIEQYQLTIDGDYTLVRL